MVRKIIVIALASIVSLGLASCDSSTVVQTPDSSPADNTPTSPRDLPDGSEPTDAPESPDTPDPVDTPDKIVDLSLTPTKEEASAFLQAASFGPTQDSIDVLQDEGYSEWFIGQQALPVDPMVPDINPTFADTTTYKWEGLARREWYTRSVYGEDQLRQRAAFALSQIFVVSTEPRDWLFKSHLQARYMDIMQENAFGNFRDLLEEVTYSPLMGEWLTYIGSSKADPVSGSMPDENYAREILQLFSIGLLELANNGQPVLDGAGQPIETYTFEDITGLSKVFTGLWWADLEFGEGASRPARKEIDIQRMVMHDEHHSTDEKTFLGFTIPANTPGDESIAQALDFIFEHNNVGPFITKQLIQRLTTSNPSDAYVERVANVFNSGSYTLPDGRSIGTGARGDMASVWAAILLDQEARTPDRLDDVQWGKVREPLIRLVHWARAADIKSTKVTNTARLEQGAPTGTIGQDPFRSESVFNFFRPGYVAVGTSTGEHGLVAPELQIITSSTAIKYPNFMQWFVLRDGGDHWEGRYDDQIALADDPEALVEHLSLTMTGGRMTDRTRLRLIETIESIEDSRDRVQLAMLLTVTSQEFNTQQ